ncbi:MAG TPA: SRPBCC family protein [Egibacteraceae bacterium]|mgnify:CR=1 FL=1
MEITHTTTIDAPVERVWQLTLDIAALPSITPTVTVVERLDDGPVTVGSRARLRQPGLPPLVWAVEEVDAAQRFRWATRLLGVRMVATHDLEPVGTDRCRLTLRVAFEGAGAGLLGRLGRRRIAAALATEGAGFARAAGTVPA